MSPKVRRKVYSMLLGKSRGQLLIVPERIRRLGQSRKDIVDVSGNESKVQCCKNAMLGLCIKAIGPGQAGAGKIEH